MSPMKLEAGGKPWRRKPSAPPAVSAASTPAALRSSERAMIASATAEITQTPGGEPVDAVDEVDHVDHGDDAEAPVSASGHERRARRRRFDAADERQREVVDA